MSRKAFEEWAKTPPPENWWDISEAERLRMTWQAASKVAFREGYEKRVAAFDEAVLLERSKAPAWHDAPNAPGLWAPPCGAVLNVTQTDLEYWKQVTTQPRWCGPLPENKP